MSSNSELSSSSRPSLEQALLAALASSSLSRWPDPSLSYFLNASLAAFLSRSGFSWISSGVAFLALDLDFFFLPESESVSEDPEMAIPASRAWRTSSRNSRSSTSSSSLTSMSSKYMSNRRDDSGGLPLCSNSLFTASRTSSLSSTPESYESAFPM